MDVDEQLEDAFEAAFAEDEAAGADDAPATAGDAGDGQDGQNIADFLEEDDYDDHEGSARGEPSRQAGGDGTMQVFHLLREGPQGSVAQPETTPAPDAAAAYKKEVFDSLTEEQKNRYEVFMRSSLPKPKMKKLMQAILLNAVPNEKAVIAMCGISKLFVGELVELARVCASQEAHTGPLLPRHVHRAYQQLGLQGKLPHRNNARRMFR
ncbi:hypothetical protein VOLCADRAFT_106752 [Volvox carteri f. nagariensis]|uniref:Transcription initiation factor TFIID subunit 11 n=1 Tax=Volvox carteri f. nagariensis TaxID=3068 RepID=D8U9I9_VOLCA|nr:uncharacterized protein VOLCADRAFT_106752 [Volvox carteri f. nagariensis]EFJ43650.1 hypothetical protein VOLCADRAFT_106752 [Volvox carteri f. nagariensis]|eukprot:XP_002955350.1 hypothetical protein VOLCADRAFT_106752 [Volvox carteri f. nagariensis]